MNNLELVGLLLGSGVLTAVVTQFGAICIERMRQKKDKSERNDTLMNKLTEISKKLDAHIDADNRNWADNARMMILRFGDEIKNGVLHTEEHYGQVMERIKDYEEFCSTHPGYKNNKAVCTIELIQDRYVSHLEHNDFL